jgi:hypothetical protein
VAWESMRRRVWALTRSPSQRDKVTAPAADGNPNCGVAAGSADVDPLPQALSGWESEGGRRAAQDHAQFEKVRSWRRRVLLKKGAVLHEAMGDSAGKCSLAMLDATGVVVSWYDPARIAERAAGKVVDRHMYQFYVPQDIANNVPDRDLRLATDNGNSTQQGWRRRADGAVFWGTTVIDAVMLRDGRLQGFSHVTRRSPGPWENVARASACVLALVILATSSPASPQNSSVMPANAKASRYGSGWECSSGFKRVDSECVAIDVPANAYLDASGNSWKCDRGYLTAGATCVAVKVPDNAYLYDAYAPGWRCKRGYREENGACMQISIPPHAHSTESAYGLGWECDRGFAQSEATCVAVKVPANGFLTRSGDSWQCERGFKRLDAACIAVAIPKNGYLDSQGDGWTCERGFRDGDSACTALVVPANAHVDYSGNDWTCNREFRRQGAGCVAD